jgi:hypothetical protein
MPVVLTPSERSYLFSLLRGEIAEYERLASLEGPEVTDEFRRIARQGARFARDLASKIV